MNWNSLSLRHRHWQEREDRRAAMAAWVLANVNRDVKQQPEPFSLEEVTQWLGWYRPVSYPAPGDCGAFWPSHCGQTSQPDRHRADAP